MKNVERDYFLHGFRNLNEGSFSINNRKMKQIKMMRNKLLEELTSYFDEKANPKRFPPWNLMFDIARFSDEDEW